MYFKPIYGSYSTKKVINYNSTFTFESKEFEIIQNLEDVYSKTNKVIVNAKGNSIKSNARRYKKYYKIEIQEMKQQYNTNSMKQTKVYSRL